MDGLFTGTKYSDNDTGWEKGKRYEAWVKIKYPQIYKGRKLTFNETEKKQLVGETLEGVEVKFDDKMKTTGRIYIEQSEKRLLENKKYVESGIFRNDNTKIWLIGDYSLWFLFSKKYLVWLDRLDPPFLYRPKPTGTSIGFCIPIKNAKLLCLDFQEFNY